jgi:DNA-binding response OmpR family regulator
MEPVTILLAFGARANQQTIADHLKGKGYNILKPRYPKEIDIITNNKPPLDFIMFSADFPGLEGFVPLLRLRQSYPATPILLLFNVINIEVLKLAQILGCNEIIKEPFECEELDTLLNKYLNHIPIH